MARNIESKAHVADIEAMLVRAAAPDALRESLSLACGEAGRVRKQRTLFLAGRTRIHLDRVEGPSAQLVEGAYLDLLGKVG